MLQIVREDECCYKQAVDWLCITSVAVQHLTSFVSDSLTSLFTPD